MDGQDEPATRLRWRLETVLDETLADSVVWQVTTDSPVTVQLPDRELTVEQSDGPDGVRWTVVLCSDGAVVSKFGQFDTVDEAVARVGSLLDADVRYTVCCDG